MKTVEWDTILPEVVLDDDEEKFEVLFSLMLYLKIPFSGFIFWLFSCQDSEVRLRAGRFMAFHSNYHIPFPPKHLFDLWYQHFPNAKFYLRSLVVSRYAIDIGMSETKAILNDHSLRFSLKTCTLENIKTLLQPAILFEKLHSLAPFLTSLFMITMSMPNNSRERKTSSADDAGEEGEEREEGEEGEEDQSLIPSVNGRDNNSLDDAMDPRFLHYKSKALLPVILVLSILIFTQNRHANMLALPLGFFARIGGADKRLLTALNSMGLSSSYWSIERLKEALTNDAISRAKVMMRQSNNWFLVFDNINVYLRKFDQRLTNRNTMLSLTNTAIISQPSAPETTYNLDEFMKLRGGRSQATVRDIEISSDDCDTLSTAMVSIVAQFLINYYPGSSKWKDLATLRKKATELMPRDRPLDPAQTHTFPFGIFDINEGTKKGCVELTKAIQKKSGLSEEEWTAHLRVMTGDWLSVNNLRSARRERAEDVSTLERLTYIKESSALWHYGLNMLGLIIKVHLGSSVDDPGSLASHKGILKRVWDINKPNYAPAKSLVRHSLIARLFSIIMTIQNIKYFDDLSKWQPDWDELLAMCKKIVFEYATPSEALRAKSQGDDWLAHSVYFIRDSLLFCIFEKYVSMADAGGILRILKFWSYAFRGAGMNNYAKECLEVLVTWKYELTPELRLALEQAWFVNKWGKPGCFIPTDLYLEHMNFWRVFVAEGSNCSAEYMVKKGSACVEAFQEITRHFSQFAGIQDVTRRHKEARFYVDVKALANHMQRHRLHTLSTIPRKILASSKSRIKKKGEDTQNSAIKDVMELGANSLLAGGFEEFIRSTTFDPALGWPLGFGEQSQEVPLMTDEAEDFEYGDIEDAVLEGTGALGGGGDFD